MSNTMVRWLTLLVALLSSGVSYAQPKEVLATCGSGFTAAAGSTINGTANTVGQECVNASVSASITGFTAASTGTPISVTTGGVTGTLPAGAVIVATNAGTTNAAYCKLGASATTSDQYIGPGGGWFAFTVLANTQLTCITSASTTTVNMVGGAGLPTGVGGIPPGGGSAVSIADGADVAEGALADAAATAGSTGSLSAKLRLMTTQLNTALTSLASIVTNTGAAIPAGSALIGKVGIDQTTPGTTNGVAVVGVNGATALAGNGATGTGSQRVTIANDSSARAVGGEGATGAAAPSGAVYAGVLGSGATGGLMAGAIVCDKYVFKHITTATDTLAVQGVASQQIRICGIKAWAAGTATFFLENTASANANCSSTLAQIDILHTMIAQSGIVDHTPFWTGLSNTSGNGLCINSTGTGGVDVGIYYAQF